MDRLDSDYLLKNLARITSSDNPDQGAADAASGLAPGQPKRRGGLMPPMRTVRSQLLF